MPRSRLILLTALALIAFAGNSLLCRAALRHTAIDAGTFTTVRLVSGALTLGLIAWRRRRRPGPNGSWISALALGGYAAGFSFAYRVLPASLGALLLFGAVQATMVGHGLITGERLDRQQWLGLFTALGGLAVLMSPGLSAPPLVGSLLMMAAGTAWGVYSLRGKGGADPLEITAGNFLRSVPLALVMSLLTRAHASADRAGLACAALSGVVTSGLGYTVWYMAVPGLRATTAAAVQLSVPVLAALGAVLLLGESITPRLVVGSAAILGGIGLVILEIKRAGS